MNERSKSICIFDDDEDILAICSYILSSRGWEVHTFPDCDRIIERLESFPPDIILMDNWIPPQGGIVSTRLIRQNEKFGRLPVIYFSANSDIKSLAKEAGADHYIAKPFDVGNFEKTILEWMRPSENT